MSSRNSQLSPKSFALDNQFYFGLIGIFIIASIVIILNSSKGDVVILLNQNRNAIADIYFQFANALVEAPCMIAIFVSLLLFKFRETLILGIIMLSISLTSNILKRMVFGNIPRPKEFFNGVYELNFLEGVNVHSAFSMPSGHTMSAFAIFGFLAFISERNELKFFFGIMAISVAISRIYLCQHFLIDVLVGASISTFICSIIYVYLSKSKLTKNQKLDGGLISRIKRL